MASSSSPPSSSYAPPTALEDLHILDFLELAGSQAKAGSELAMHQSTVCRSLQLMQLQFRLAPRQGSSVCRHGHNACLQHLRLAYREHRLMEGLLRIGTDVLHQRLLQGMAGIQRVPPRFRSGEHWAELVRHGLLDAAIVSSFCLEKLLLSGQPRGGFCYLAREPHRSCGRRWSGMALQWSSSQRPARTRRPGLSGRETGS